MHPDVRVGAEIVGLPRVVEIHDSTKSALEAFAQAGAVMAGAVTPPVAAPQPSQGGDRRTSSPSRIEEGAGAPEAVVLQAFSGPSLIAAVGAVSDRAGRASAALRQAGIPHVVVGGLAVAAWVARVDQEAVRTSQDVHLLVRREDFPRVVEALQAVGFVPREIAGAYRFLDGPRGSVRGALGIVFAGEKVRADDRLPAPEVTDAEAGPGFPVPTLDALVRMTLTSFRLQDQLHLLDMLEVGLIDGRWCGRVPPELGARLAELVAQRDRES
jgi:hypothetical protein